VTPTKSRDFHRQLPNVCPSSRVSLSPRSLNFLSSIRSLRSRRTVEFLKIRVKIFEFMTSPKISIFSKCLTRKTIIIHHLVSSWDLLWMFKKVKFVSFLSLRSLNSLNSRIFLRSIRVVEYLKIRAKIFEFATSPKISIFSTLGNWR
jgi:hypothetical protein